MPESKELQAEVMAAWGAGYAKMGTAVVDGGNPFSNAINVSENGVSDGSASTPPANGYTIIVAESLDAVVEAVQDHPHLKDGGQITVHETFEM